MAENTNTTPEATATEEKKPNLFKRAQTRFPRTTKAVTITGAVIGGLATATVLSTAYKNRSHLSAAGDHLGEAVDELSSSVSPTDTEA